MQYSIKESVPVILLPLLAERNFAFKDAHQLFDGMPKRDRLTMESGDNEDRISQLPDPILHHILSKAFYFKETIDIVRICILLSKRWSNLWASFPSLHFDEWGRHPDLDSTRSLNLNYARLVNTVLLRRDTTDVHGFFLRRTDDSDEHEPHRLVTWMRYAINHNVKVLVIHVNLDEQYFKLPSGIFTCWSMEELDLKIRGHGYMGVGYIEIPEFVQLGRLRKLHLQRFSGCPVSLNVLLSGCPVLEDMELSNCMLQDPDICSNSLTNLKFWFCKIMGTIIRISVPSLQYLDLTANDIDRSEVWLENLPSLAKASLQTHDYAGHNYSDKDIKLLNYISPSNKCISGNELSGLQSFHNLKQLHLDGLMIIDNLPLIAHFLHRSPNLELITLDMEVVISLDPILKKKQMKIDFECPHLKDILATFDEKSDEISELLNDFCDEKCSCFEE